MTEPKKSARLAEKRKLREESGTPVSEDDYYFTPLFSTKVSTTKHRSCSPSNSRGTPSPSPLGRAVTPPSSRRSPKCKTTPKVFFPTASRLEPPKIPGWISADRDRVEFDCNMTSKTETRVTNISPEDNSIIHKKRADADLYEELDNFHGSAMLGNIDAIGSIQLLEEGNEYSKPRNHRITPTTTDDKTRKAFLSNSSGNFLICPQDQEMDLASQKLRNSQLGNRESKVCGVLECQRPRKYVCSKTKISLCSLECYKKNMESMAKLKNQFDSNQQSLV